MNHKVQSFDRLIAVHENGTFNHDATEALNAIMDKMTEQMLSKGGVQSASLSVTFKFRQEGDQITVDATLNHSVAKPPRSKRLYWHGEGNRLSMVDEKQMQMPFKDVNREHEPRNAANGYQQGE